MKIRLLRIPRRGPFQRDRPPQRYEGERPRSARSARVTDFASAGGDLEIVAIDSGDRDHLFDELESAFETRPGRTLIKIEAKLDGTGRYEVLETIVTRIGEQLGGEAKRMIKEAFLDRARRGRYPGRPVTLQVLTGDNSPVHLVNSMNVDTGLEREEIEALAELAARATEQHGGQIIALIDHAEWFSEGQGGNDWLVHYKSLAGPHTIIRMLIQPPPARRWPHRDVLPPFQDQDIADLLPPANSHSGIVSVIREVTHNEPWLIHALVSQVVENEILSEADLRRALNSGKSSRDIWDFLSRLVFVGKFAYLKDVVLRLAMLRTLRDGAVLAVISEVVPAEMDLSTVYDDLRRIHLVDSDAVPLLDTPGFQLLDRVVAAATVEAEKYPEVRNHIHSLAADYYWSLVNPPEADDEDGEDEADDGDEGGEGGEGGDGDGDGEFGPGLELVDAGYQQYWTRFESNKWLADLRQWIHHSRHTTAFWNDAVYRRVVRLKLTRWYLEGFFWFEIMATHHFCGDLISEWDDWAADVQVESDWLEHIKKFHTSFGRGAFPEKYQPAPNWTVARQAIAEIRKGIPVTRSNRPPQKPTDESAGYALALHLEAETIRVSKSVDSYGRAERLYRQAYEWHLDDDWAKAWAIHDRISLGLVAGTLDDETALAEIGEVGQTAEDEGDKELHALSLCRLAEIHSAAGRHAEAAQAIAAALAVMLHYNTKQEPALTEPNNFPNQYTRESYLEIQSVADAILVGLRRSAPDVEGRFSAVCARLFSPFSGVWDQLRGWAPPPTPEDLDRTDTTWLAMARDNALLIEDLGVLEMTVNTPMPWFDAFVVDPV